MITGSHKLSLSIIISFLILTIVTACSLFSNDSAAVLWTDRPEIAAYVELFNAETEGRRIEVVYTEIPWKSLENEAEHPDLVAGTRLDSVLSIRHFATVDRLVDSGVLKPAGFYHELFEMGRKDEKTYLLPLSFSLPIVVFADEFSTAFSDDYLITADEMRRFAVEYNIVDGRPTRMGYSPRWQPEFIYGLAVLLGAEFNESDERLPVWNDAMVQQALLYSIEWTETTNGGYELEDHFVLKYMYNPLYKLLDTSRILFNFMRIEEFLALPAAIREHLDFRWLSDGSKIAVWDDVLFVGKTRQSRKRKTADAFLAWLFDPVTQGKLLETAQFERTRSFGLAGGFSSLISINVDALPRYFPFLIGHVPDGDSLDFPNRLPEAWADLRNSVIIPWLSTASKLDATAVPLSEAIRLWRLQQHELYR